MKVLGTRGQVSGVQPFLMPASGQKIKLGAAKHTQSVNHATHIPPFTRETTSSQMG